MFQIGDQVFCPMRGSGIIEAIEERTMLDTLREYFIIKMQSSNMTMMIPTNRIATSGFRPINDEAVVDTMISILADKDVVIDRSVPLKQRVKDNQAKLSTGSFADCSEVIRDLTSMQREKALNASENSMLMEARRLLLEELAMIKQISKEEASDMIDEFLA